MKMICYSCDGYGQVRYSFGVWVNCADCRGAGWVKAQRPDKAAKDKAVQPYANPAKPRQRKPDDPTVIDVRALSTAPFVRLFLRRRAMKLLVGPHTAEMTLTTENALGLHAALTKALFSPTKGDQ